MESASNSSKKRKICLEEDEEEQEEEAKMEKFFALVRSIRETRDRWINFRSGEYKDTAIKNKKSKNIVAVDMEENRSVAVWKPRFQLEDFAEEKARCQNPDPSLALLAGASKSNNCAKEDDAEKGIDLRLTL